MSREFIEYCCRNEMEKEGNCAYGIIRVLTPTVERAGIIDYTYDNKTFRQRGVFPRMTRRVIERVCRTLVERISSPSSRHYVKGTTDFSLPSS